MRLLTLTVAALALGAQQAHAGAPEACPTDGPLEVICGPQAVEDLVRVPATHWVIGSGFSPGDAPGALHAIDTVSHEWSKLYPSEQVAFKPEPARYPDCAAPGAARLSAHGLAIRRDRRHHYTLFVVNHTDRESVEVFRLSIFDDTPALTWTGCIPLPDDVFANGIATTPDGFVVTKFYDRRRPFDPRAMYSGTPTGGVYRWSPGRGLRPVAGTEVAGANGIETTRDGRTMYVAASGAGALVQFAQHGRRWKQQRVSLGIAVDNVHWGSCGNLIVAGQALRPDGGGTAPGWKVLGVDPHSLESTLIAEGGADSPLRSVSTALDVGDGIWLGSARGDRIAFLRGTWSCAPARRPR